MPSNTAAVPVLHCRSFGSGETPTALALHCGQASGAMWRGIATQLAGAATIVAPDFPGHGRSDPWPEGRDVHDAATHAATPFLKAPMHLVGHSFGGTVALRIALEDPRRVTSLTLIEPVLFATLKGTAAGDTNDAADAPLLDACRSGDMSLAARLFNRRWGDGTRWDALPAVVRNKMQTSMPFIIASRNALYHDAAGLLASGRLEALEVPVLFIRGADTVPEIAAIHSGLRSRLPITEEVVVHGAGHMVPITHAAEVARALSSHWSKYPGEGAAGAVGRSP